MKRVLAISGGVDSMFLLDKYKNDKDAVVAHFDHGTRPSSIIDAEFVKAQAEASNLLVFVGRAKLGENVSEATAREARYKFLYETAKKAGGKIYTAHHLNDLVESVAINILRGTSWRGLTPFGQKDIVRPFLNISKKTLHKMAAEKGLLFRQDPTNNESNYLRNRVREKTDELSEETLKEVWNLYEKQVKLREEIETEIANILPKDGRYERSWFLDMDDAVAIEVLRAALEKAGISATRPQIEDFLVAIRTYGSHKKFNLPNNTLVTIYKDYFVL